MMINLSEGASRENHEEAGRFEAVNQEMLERLSKLHAPKNTQLNTQWAMNTFSAWWKWHNNLESSVLKC